MILIPVIYKVNIKFFKNLQKKYQKCKDCHCNGPPGYDTGSNLIGPECHVPPGNKERP